MHEVIHENIQHGEEIDNTQSACKKLNYAMVERIKVDPPCNLEVIDHDVGIEFLICSQRIYERWYAMNLDIERCECEDRVSICKHLFAVRKLVDEEFTYLKRILSIEEDGFINNLDDVGEDDVVSLVQSPEQDDNLGIV